MIKQGELVPGALVFDTVSTDESFEVILLLGAVLDDVLPTFAGYKGYSATMLNHRLDGKFELTEEAFEEPNEHYEVFPC